MSLYDTIGRGYAGFRRADARIAAAIDAALGDAASVVNVGAGAGSYEPRGRTVLAVEPSLVMIRQRHQDAAPCLQGSAEALPLESGSFDAALTVLSAHHWTDPERGFGEMRRVARRRAVLLTWVPDAEPFWLTRDYFPEIAAQDRKLFPASAALVAMLERIIGPVTMAPLAIPHDCADGFLCAYWRRPEAYLNPEIRGAMSSFAGFDAGPGLARLSADLAGGRWTKRNRHLLALDCLDAGYRIISCEITGRDRQAAQPASTGKKPRQA